MSFFIDKSGDTDAQSTCSRLGECEVCGNNAKYTCPCCELKTCSVACINIHKKEFECDGKRQKVKFIHREAFKDKDIESDYRLLEEISQGIETFKRDPASYIIHRNSGLPPHLIRLQTEAIKRGVLLKFLPQHFSRHKVNTTYLDWKANTLSWHIEWIFPQADNLTLSDARVLDSARLSSVLSKLLKTAADTPHIFKSMQYYCSAGLSGVKLLLKAEQERGDRYFELDPSQTLRESLEGKAIIEFPVIHVILKDHKDEYDIITTDEEEEIQNRNKHARSRKRILSRENDTININGLKHNSVNKNLLMSAGNESDDADEDDSNRQR